MKLMVKKYFSPDERCWVEVCQRKDALWEVEGFMTVTDTPAESGSYRFLKSVLGLTLTE
jgi:hypothetical protein